MEKSTFPYDPVNRIQKLFYDYDFDDPEEEKQHHNWTGNVKTCRCLYNF